MARPIDKSRLIKHFNKYLDYRKQVERTGESFTEKLSKANTKDIGPNKSKNLRNDRKYAPPRLSNKSKNITMTQANRLARLAPLIQDSATRHNVPVELICGVILQESGGNPKAVSHAGAKGLMQLMPATAKRFGVTNSFDPQQNIDAGTKYLKWLMNRFDGNVELALAGYNAGEGNVEKYGNKIPPFKETQNYVPNVLAYTQSMIDIFSESYAKAEPLPSHARRA